MSSGALPWHGSRVNLGGPKGHLEALIRGQAASGRDPGEARMTQKRVLGTSWGSKVHLEALNWGQVGTRWGPGEARKVQKGGEDGAKGAPEGHFCGGPGEARMVQKVSEEGPK